MKKRTIVEHQPGKIIGLPELEIEFDDGKKETKPALYVKFPYSKWMLEDRKTQETRTFALHEHKWYKDHFKTGIILILHISYAQDAMESLKTFIFLRFL